MALTRASEGNVTTMRRRPGDMPEKWRSKHEEAVKRRRGDQFPKLKDERDETQTVIDLGELENGEFKNKRIRVKICGRTIWNYPSDTAMARGGWLQYPVIAKDSKLKHAVVLCRNWPEFWELNVLAMFGYSPASSWSSWIGDRLRQQHLHLGLVTYLHFDQAENTTTHHQTGARARGLKMHETKEYKNFICGYIRRNYAVSRRFVQYLQMQSSKLCALVRDAKTGRILIKPPDDELWLARHKSGIGRAAKGEWIVTKKVGEDMFETLAVGKQKSWRFGFNDYYDLQIWDLQPGQPYEELYLTVQNMLIKVNQFCDGLGFYKPLAPVLETLHREDGTGRVRDARPGEETIYEDMPKINVDVCGTVEDMHEAVDNFIYNDREADKDLLLFLEETGGKASKAIVETSDPIMVRDVYTSQEKHVNLQPGSQN